MLAEQRAARLYPGLGEKPGKETHFRRRMVPPDKVVSRGEHAAKRPEPPVLFPARRRTVI
jgi:hypothetical protein